MSSVVTRWSTGLLSGTGPLARGREVLRDRGVGKDREVDRDREVGRAVDREREVGRVVVERGRDVAGGKWVPCRRGVANRGKRAEGRRGVVSPGMGMGKGGAEWREGVGKHGTGMPAEWER